MATIAQDAPALRDGESDGQSISGRALDIGNTWIVPTGTISTPGFGGNPTTATQTTDSIQVYENTFDGTDSQVGDEQNFDGLLAITETGAADCTISLLIWPNGAIGDAIPPGIVFRYVDPHNYSVAYVDIAQLDGDGIGIWEITAGVVTHTFEDDDFVPAAGKLLTVTLSGSSITVNYDPAGANYTQSITSTLRQTATKHGIYVGAGNVSNFEVDGEAAPPPATLFRRTQSPRTASRGVNL